MSLKFFIAVYLDLVPLLMHPTEELQEAFYLFFEFIKEQNDYSKLSVGSKAPEIYYPKF